MVNIGLFCFLFSLPGPPKVVFDSSTFQLYPINTKVCSTFDAFRDTTFHLYTRSNINNSQLLRTGDDSTLTTSNMNFEDPTIIFIHDYLESYKSRDAVKLKDGYLKRGKYNVILVNSERLVAGPYFFHAVLNVEPIAFYMTDFVDYLVGKGLDLGKVHVIGTGLGAQIAGVFGKNLKSGKVARMTGLDPLGPWFTHRYPRDRLSSGDAVFVDVIHTNAGFVGIGYPVGDVDIWFNGGRFQPGCNPISSLRRSRGSIIQLLFCNHYQAWRLYVETLTNPTEYLVVKCKNHHDYKKGKCNGNEKIYAGVDVNTASRGNFYLDTGVTAMNV